MFPKVSVVIPCYNQAQYLTECVQSVLAQTFEDWEAIVVDDASTDRDVSAIVQSFRDQRIRLIRHDRNRGLSAARNSGVRCSLAPIVVPLDADDKLAPTHLEIVSKNLADKSVDFVYFDIQCFGASTAIWYSRPFDPKAVVREHLFIQAQAPFKRKVWERCGGWCEELVFEEDVDFWVSAARCGLVGKYIDQPLYHYRIRPGSLSDRMRIHVLPIYRRIFERHRDFILRYSTYSDWMARGYLEAAHGYIKLRKPHMAFACGVWVGLTSPCKRPQVLQLIVMTAKMLTPAFLLPVARAGRDILRRVIRSA